MTDPITTSHSDWIMLHRRALDSQVFSDAQLWHVWSWCLLRANWGYGWYAGHRIEPGQFACGRESASMALGISGSAWYRRMRKLESLGCVTLKSNNKFTIVCIVNWLKYQPSRTTSEQPANNQRTTGEQPADTREEEKQQQEEKKFSQTNTRELSQHWCSEDFQTVWFAWLSHVAAMMDRPVTDMAEEQMLYKLAMFATNEAIEVVRFSILKQAKNLILNGDHKQEVGGNKASFGRKSKRMEIVND